MVWATCTRIWEEENETIRWPVFITAVAVAAVLGGGVGGVAADYISSSNLAASNEAQQSPQLNRTDNVTPTTEAAAVASPSVVTLSVGGEQAEAQGPGNPR